MTQVVVPVRYPLSKHSRATLRRAIEIADREDASLTVLHVNLYQSPKRVSRADLKAAVEDAFSPPSQTRYLVRTGILVEETILDEIAQLRADVVVIGEKQASRWRQMIRRIANNPDIEEFLQNQVDAKVVTASVA